MSFSKKGLKKVILDSINSEVANHTDEQGNFNPEGFDGTCYIQSIYDYIKDEVTVKGLYNGNIPGVGPDEANGTYEFKFQSVGNQGLVKQDASNKIFRTKEEIDLFINTWWSSLLSSIIMESKLTENSRIPKISISTPLSLVASQIEKSDISDPDSTYIDNWDLLSEDIYTAVLSSVIPDTPIIAQSIYGGVGTIVFNSIH